MIPPVCYYTLLIAIISLTVSHPVQSSRLQWSAVTVTPSGIGKSVTVTDCHSNSSYKMTHI